MGDPRLTKRLITISARFAGHPGASIPRACETPDRLKAAYRFFDNDQGKEGEILAPQPQARKTRMAAQRVGLAIQDATPLDFTPHPASRGPGRLRATAPHGLCQPPTLLVTPQKVPRGLADHLVRERPAAAPLAGEWRSTCPAAQANRRARPSWRCPAAGSVCSRPGAAPKTRTWNP